LGYDLTHYLKTYRKFSLKCVLNIADQLLTVLEAIHKRSVLHRDIKPENILTGRDQESQVLYLVDYGISKFYKDTKG
jgi:casein kinase 1, delta